MDQQRRPRAFISCSLRPEDKPFVGLITAITQQLGFQAVGTVGKFGAAPLPIPEQMTEGIRSADCIILAATPRYIQEDVHNRKRTGKGISEMLHVEVGMAVMAKRPILAFVEEGTDVGSFLPQTVQFIQLKHDNLDDIKEKWPLIQEYFRSAMTIIQNRWMEENRSDLLKTAGIFFGIIGAATVLDSLLGGNK